MTTAEPPSCYDVAPPSWTQSIPRSPYGTWKGTSATGRQSTASLIVHLLAWALAVAWFAGVSVRLDEGRTIPAILMASSAFVAAGPALVARWEASLLAFARSIAVTPTAEQIRPAVERAIARVVALRHVVVIVPVLLIVVAYVAGDDAFADSLQLPTSGVTFLIGLVILALGSLAAGWGIFGALCTIAISIAIGRQRVDFAPYAGTPSRVAEELAGFSFTTATMFGIAGAILMPGLAAAAWVASGAAQVALLVVIGLVLIDTIALLAVPAVMLSLRTTDDRSAYLDQLSRRIDELGAAATDLEVPFSEEQYVRLRALLEMRSHVVGHSLGPSSVELVKRIPVAVVLPVGSLVASWLSLIAG